MPVQVALEAKSVKVLWGSQTGTATGFADDLAREISAMGIPASSLDLRKYDPVRDLVPNEDPTCR